MKNDNKNKGFTLAELLIVVAIIGVLVAVSIPIFNSQLEKAKQATDLSNMRSAKAAAVAEWLTNSASSEQEYVYDAGAGRVYLKGETIPAGYGRSSTPVTSFSTVMTGASGTPNENGTANYITVKIDMDGNVQLLWGTGNDLNTVEGRLAEDRIVMDKIANALIAAFNSGSINSSLNKNFVTVSVFPDGKIDYFSDKGGRSEENTAVIKQALSDAGIREQDLILYGKSEDYKPGETKWNKGYTVMFDFNNYTMYYILNDPGTNTNEGIGSYTWSSRGDKTIYEYKTNN